MKIGKGVQEKMRQIGVALFVMSATFAVWAKPAAKVPVATGYPDWKGLVPANHIRGRELCASDLRHKITTIVVFDANQMEEQLALTWGCPAICPMVPPGMDWERETVKREHLVVYTCAGTARKSAIAEATRIGGKIKKFNEQVSVYADVTFDGLPTPAELPHIYVFGPEGTEPIFSKKADLDSLKAFGPFVRAQVAKLPKWERFYGSVGEENRFPKLAKAVKAGKPLAPAVADLVKGIESPDPALAKEAQILYDAVEQTRSELGYQVSLLYYGRPFLAKRDLIELLKYWPKEKSAPRLSAALKHLETKDAATICNIYLATQKWSDPDFTCKNAGEVKKIVQELKKMQKTLEPLKTSANIKTQDCAHILSAKVDALLAEVPNRIR